MLTKLESSSSQPPKRYRKPTVIVMAPTRELVSQIASDFESLISTNLRVLTIYGGVSYDKQINALKDGIDIVAGAPGRMRDLINKGHLDLSEIKYVILDEVDRMLDMGFQDIVDEILAHIYPVTGVGNDVDGRAQTLLFSATMPHWIDNIVRKYLRTDAVKICLVDAGDSKAASTVEHLAIQCPWRERAGTIPDIIRVHGGGNQARCIIFCERKKDADELAAHSAMKSDCHVLHGDVPQDKRELVLQKFREGKYR